MVEFNTNAALELLRLSPQADTRQGNEFMARGLAQMMQNRRAAKAADLLGQGGGEVPPNVLAQAAALDPTVAQMFAQSQAQQQRQQFQQQQYQDEGVQKGQERVSLVSREADKVGTRAYLEALSRGEPQKDAEKKGADSRNSFLSARSSSGELPQSMATHLITQPFAPTPIEKTSQELRNEAAVFQAQKRAELAEAEHQRRLQEIAARTRAISPARSSGGRSAQGQSAAPSENNFSLDKLAFALEGGYGRQYTLSDLPVQSRNKELQNRAIARSQELRNLKASNPEEYQRLLAEAGADPVLLARQAMTDKVSARNVAAQASANSVALETAFRHADTLIRIRSEIPNLEGPRNYNALKVSIRKQMGDKQLAAFDSALAGFTEEVAKYFHGAGVVPQSQIDHWKDVLSSSDSTKVFNEKMKIIKELMDGRRVATTDVAKALGVDMSAILRPDQRTPDAAHAPKAKPNDSAAQISSQFGF